MSFVVTIPLTLVPGKGTFAQIPDAGIRLREYGWGSVSVDSGAAGKLATQEVRPIVFSMSGKPGATQATAETDVERALTNMGLWQYRAANVRAGVGAAIKAAENAPAELAGKIGEAAGKAAGGAVAGLGAGKALGIAAVGIVALAVVVAVAVFAIRAKTPVT